jgi:hypothetical protein
MSTEQRLRKAILDLKSPRRNVVAAAAKELEAIILDNPDSHCADQARAALGGLKTPASPDQPELHRDERDLLNRLSHANSWDSAILGELDGLVLKSPSQTFPAKLADALSGLIHRLQQRPLTVRARASRLSKSLVDLAKIGAYETAISAISDKFAEFSRSAESQLVAQEIVSLIKRRDSGAANVLLRDRLANDPENVALLELDKNFTLIDTVDAQISALPPVDMLNLSDLGKRIDHIRLLCEQLDDRFAEARNNFLGCLRAIDEEIERAVANSVANSATFDSMGCVLKALEMAKRPISATAAAAIDLRLHELAAKAIEPFRSPRQVRELIASLVQWSGDQQPRVRASVQSQSSQLGSLAERWEGILRGETSDRKIDGSLTDPVKLTADLDALENVRWRYDELFSAARNGMADRAGIDALLTDSSAWPSLHARVGELLSIAEAAGLKSRLERALRDQDWPCLPVLFQDALAMNPQPGDIISSWSQVVSNGAWLRSVAKHSDSCEQDEPATLVEWWKTWDGLLREMAGWQKYPNQALDGWLESIEARASILSDAVLDRWLHERSTQELAVVASELLQLAHRPSATGKFASQADAKRQLALAEDALNSRDWVKVEAIAEEIEKSGAADLAVTLRNRTVLDRAKLMGVEKFALAILSHAARMSRSDPDLVLAAALDAISLLWRERPLSITLLSDICSIDVTRANVDLRRLHAQERSFLAASQGNAVTLATDMTPTIVNSSEPQRGKWSARLEMLQRDWLGGGSIAKAVWAGIVIGELRDALPDIESERQKLRARDEEVVSAIAAACRAFTDVAEHSLDSLATEIEERIQLYDELSKIFACLPRQDVVLQMPVRLRGAREIAQGLLTYIELRAGLTDVRSAGGLNRRRDELLSVLADLSRRAASLGFAGIEDRGIVNRIDALARSFDFRNEWIRLVGQVQDLEKSSLYDGWASLIGVCRNLGSYWSAIGLAVSSGLAQAILQEMWIALEGELGDRLKIPASLDLPAIGQRLHELRDSSDRAASVGRYLLQNVSVPEDARQHSVVDGLLGLLSPSAPEGGQTRKYYQYLFGEWTDIRDFLALLRDQLPSWVFEIR